MINKDDIKIINPNDRIPAIKQYFLLAYATMFDYKEIIHFSPAVLKCFCKPEDFFANIAILSEEGNIWPAKNPRVQLLGWAEMFPGTKCFTITHV